MFDDKSSELVSEIAKKPSKAKMEPRILKLQEGASFNEASFLGCKLGFQGCKTLPSGTLFTSIICSVVIIANNWRSQ